MGFARKYILNVTNFTSHGVGADALTTQYDLTAAFSGVTNTGSGTAYSYLGITVAALGTMSIEAYNQRVTDFLSYSQIDTNTQKNNLLTEAIVEDPSCDLYPCMLNNNFTIYKFLTGVRIINIGSTYGVAEYAVYIVPPPSPTSTTSTTIPTTATTTTTTTTATPIAWTTNPTFLNLNPAATYIALVRDNASGEIICITPPKTFIINNLIPSTTTTSTTSTTHTPTITTTTTVATTTIAPVTKYVTWGGFTELSNTSFEQEWTAGLEVYPPMTAGDSFTIQFGTCAQVCLSAGTLPESLLGFSCATINSTDLSKSYAEMPAGSLVGYNTDFDYQTGSSIITPSTIDKYCACVFTCRPNNLFTDRCGVVFFNLLSSSGSNFVTDSVGSTFCVTCSFTGGGGIA